MLGVIRRPLLLVCLRLLCLRLLCRRRLRRSGRRWLSHRLRTWLRVPAGLRVPPGLWVRRGCPRRRSPRGQLLRVGVLRRVAAVLRSAVRLLLLLLWRRVAAVRCRRGVARHRLLRMRLRLRHPNTQSAVSASIHPLQH